MVWSDDEDGQQTIALVFKPHTGWEVAETFIIAIYDIQGFPASDGSGQADPLANSVAITVSKVIIILAAYLHLLSVGNCRNHTSKLLRYISGILRYVLESYFVGSFATFTTQFPTQ